MALISPETPVSIDIDGSRDFIGESPRPASSISSGFSSSREATPIRMANEFNGNTASGSQRRSPESDLDELPKSPSKENTDVGSLPVMSKRNLRESSFQISNGQLFDEIAKPVTDEIGSRRSHVFARDESILSIESDISLPNFDGLISRPVSGKLPYSNGAIVDDESGIEISDLPHVPSPAESESPSIAQSYKIATKSIPKRPKTASRPQTTGAVPNNKPAFVTQSIPNLRGRQTCLSFVSNEDRRPSTSSSTSRENTSSSTGSRKSSTISRIASALLPRFTASTSKSVTHAWEEDEDDMPSPNLSPRPPTSSRPNTSTSKSSRTDSNKGSTVSLTDSESPRDDEDLQWRTKLRPNCFLPHLSEKYLCPACTNVLYYPVQLSHCDHLVCSPCLANIMRGVRSCPIDRKSIDRSKVFVKREFGRELRNKKLSCPQCDLGCDWVGTYETFKAHYLTCPHADVICPNGCGHRCERRHVDQHAIKECSFRMVVCEFCNRAVRAEKEIDHLKQCPRFPVSCSNSCGVKQIPREELQRHIEEHCTLGEVKCPFRRMGCCVSGTREFIRRHVADDLTNHIEMLCLEINKSADKIQEHSESIDRQALQIKENEFQVLNVSRRQGCQLLWKIDQWSQRIVEATTGRKTILKSPPFYTGKYGYKLGLSLMPNGDGKAKGKNLSMYVCICKGEYDALQTWPFSMTVTFTLIDQCQDPRAKVDHSFVLRPNPCKENLPFLGRPTANTNPSFGAQCFAALDMLETRDYVREDVIFTKIDTESSS